MSEKDEKEEEGKSGSTELKFSFTFTTPFLSPPPLPSPPPPRTPFIPSRYSAPIHRASRCRNHLTDAALPSSLPKFRITTLTGLDFAILVIPIKRLLGPYSCFG